MKKRTKEELEKLFGVFRKETLENFFTLLKHLRDNDLSPEDIGRHLDFKRKAARETRRLSEKEMAKKKREAEKTMEKWREKVRKCPKCDSPLLLSKISTLKGNANRKGWRSLWSCPSEDCTFEEYSREFADKIYTELMEG